MDAMLANDPECLHLGCEFADFSQDDDSVTITFANGNSATVDGLVGCDGVASVVRPAMFGPEPVVYTGMVSYRGLIPAALVTESVANENGSFYVGPDQMFLLYFVRGTEFMNVVAHARQPGGSSGPRERGKSGGQDPGRPNAAAGGCRRGQDPHAPREGRGRRGRARAARRQVRPPPPLLIRS